VFARAHNTIRARGAAETVIYVSVGLETDLSIEEVLNEYGTPEKYLAYDTYLEVVEGGHAPAVVLAMYYPNQGLVFEVWALGFGKEEPVDAETLVNWIHCFPSTSLDQLIQDVPDMKGRYRWEGPLQDWEGIDSIHVFPFTGPEGDEQ
jgi:hypothetical protein